VRLALPASACFRLPLLTVAPLVLLLLLLARNLRYFNASGGRDHLFIYSMDQGMMCSSKVSALHMTSHKEFFVRVLHPMIFIGYDGTRRMKVPASHESALRKTCFWVSNSVGGWVGGRVSE
jgi:hypothetical protein